MTHNLVQVGDIEFDLGVSALIEKKAMIEQLTVNALAFNEKRKVNKGYINTCTYCLNKNVFEQPNMPEKFSFETDFLQKKINEFNSNSFITNGYFIDIGIQDDYQRFQKEVEKGCINSSEFKV